MHSRPHLRLLLLRGSLCEPGPNYFTATTCGNFSTLPAASSESAETFTSPAETSVQHDLPLGEVRSRSASLPCR